METQWTIVRHSAYGYQGGPQFKRAVETRGILLAGEARIVQKAGGVLFSTYREAEEFAFSASYPEGNSGIIPAAGGTFSDKEIDGLRVYVPVRKVIG